MSDKITDFKAVFKSIYQDGLYDWKSGKISANVMQESKENTQKKTRDWNKLVGGSAGERFGGGDLGGAWSRPARVLLFVLFLQPFQQRVEVVDEGLGAHLALTGDGFHGVLPRFGGPHPQHLPTE